LFLTGLVLSAQPVRLSGNVGFGVAMKNLIQPALAGLLAFWLLAGAEARIAVVLAAVPSGAFGVLFAVRSGVPSDLIGTTLIVSTVASAVTLAAAILLSAAIWG
jgi:malonate transporter